MPNTARIELARLAATRIVAVYSYPAHAVYRRTRCQGKSYRILRHLQKSVSDCGHRANSRRKFENDLRCTWCANAKRRQGVLRFEIYPMYLKCS